MFEGMLEGWWRQQRSWLSQEATIKPRLALVRRFAEFTGLMPWQWTPAEVETFTCSGDLGRDAVGALHGALMPDDVSAVL